MAACLALAAGCGKKGPPLPPLRHGPDRVTSLACKQRGKLILLTGILPDKNQDGGPLAPLQELRLFRADRGGLATGPGMSGRSGQRTALRLFTREAKRIQTLSGEALGKVISGRRFNLIDSDPFPGGAPEKGQELTYAVTVVDSDRRSSPLSQLVPLHWMPPPLPPSNLRSELSEKKIRLSWEPPAAVKNEVIHFNLYRSERQDSFPDRPQNDKPLPQPFFDDEIFSFGTIYYYMVTSVEVDRGVIRESEGSLVVPVSPVDIYPPAVPTGLAVSAENGVIKLYWFPNSEGDLGGYRIYRSEKEGEGFENIGSAGAAESTFVDQTAKPGVKYYYGVTAVDQANPPNESARSEIHGDRLPPKSSSVRKPQSRP
jgi:hypothetical protein